MTRLGCVSRSSASASTCYLWLWECIYLLLARDTWVLDVVPSPRRDKIRWKMKPTMILEHLKPNKMLPRMIHFNIWLYSLTLKLPWYLLLFLKMCVFIESSFMLYNHRTYIQLILYVSEYFFFIYIRVNVNWSNKTVMIIRSESSRYRINIR